MTHKKKGAPQTDAPPGPGAGRFRSRTVIHVVCEGHTERDYFQHLNKWYGEKYGFSVHLTPRRQRADKSFQPLDAVKEARATGEYVAHEQVYAEGLARTGSEEEAADLAGDPEEYPDDAFVPPVSRWTGLVAQTRLKRTTSLTWRGW